MCTTYILVGRNREKENLSSSSGVAATQLIYYRQSKQTYTVPFLQPIKVEEKMHDEVSVHKHPTGVHERQCWYLLPEQSHSYPNIFGLKPEWSGNCAVYVLLISHSLTT